MKTFNNHFSSMDVFSGIGGLSEGMHQANFQTLFALESSDSAARTYKLNHPNTEVILRDIRDIPTAEIKEKLSGKQIHLYAGCPPCQGFSSIRRLNKINPVEDERNNLIMEFVRIGISVNPYTIMLENVPGLINYDLFKDAISTLRNSGFKWIDFQVVDVKDYGVPQTRKRLVLVGSKLGPILIAKPTGIKKTVRDAIGHLPLPRNSKDFLHKVFPNHTKTVQQRIKLTPKDGGGRKDLPKKFMLSCHLSENVGFNDVYGRLKWDSHSTTITGGCLNPSKGRFLHPVQNRCISAREASLLQTFPKNYKFHENTPISKLALMIGNALPPLFSYIQSENIRQHLIKHLD